VAFFSLIDFHAGVTVRTNPCTEFKVVRTVVPHVARVAVQTPVMPKRKVSESLCCDHKYTLPYPY
jgi:hypothetical protein